MREIVDRPREGSPAAVGDAKRALLVSYRRDASPVPTPVWAALGQDGCLYVRSERAAGKVKRLRRDPRVLLAPCTKRGTPLGLPFEASARVLEREDEAHAEAVLDHRYGFGRELFERTVDLMRIDMCYLEITPGAWG